MGFAFATSDLLHLLHVAERHGQLGPVRAGSQLEAGNALHLREEGSRRVLLLQREYPAKLRLHDQLVDHDHEEGQHIFGSVDLVRP